MTGEGWQAIAPAITIVTTSFVGAIQWLVLRAQKRQEAAASEAATQVARIEAQTSSVAAHQTTTHNSLGEIKGMVNGAASEARAEIAALRAEIVLLKAEQETYKAKAETLLIRIEQMKHN